LSSERALINVDNARSTFHFFENCLNSHREDGCWWYYIVLLLGNTDHGYLLKWARHSWQGQRHQVLVLTTEARARLTVTTAFGYSCFQCLLVRLLVTHEIFVVCIYSLESCFLTKTTLRVYKYIHTPYTSM